MLDAIRKITLYVHDPEAALRFWTEQCHFVKRADHRMGPVRWLEVAPSDASPTSSSFTDKALMQQQNAHRLRRPIRPSFSVPTTRNVPMSR